MNDQDHKEEYSDFANVEKQRNYLVPENFPEGPYGSPINKDKPVENKSTPFREGQRRYSAFNYENKTLHENMPRQMEGAHPTHDDPDSSIEAPYDDYQK